MEQKIDGRADGESVNTQKADGESVQKKTIRDLNLILTVQRCWFVEEKLQDSQHLPAAIRDEGIFQRDFSL